MRLLQRSSMTSCCLCLGVKYMYYVQKKGYCKQAETCPVERIVLCNMKEYCLEAKYYQTFTT